MEVTAKNKIDVFFSKYKMVNYNEGELILRAYQKPEFIFYLKEGYVKLSSISNKGNEITLHIFKPPSVIPLMWAIADIPNKHSYEALTFVSAVKAPKDLFINFISKNPEVLLDLTQRLFKGISGLLLRLENQVFEESGVRVSSTLSYLAKHFGEKERNSTKIKIKFTHSDIAKIAGTTRETASKEMRKLVNSKNITYENHLIKVINLKKLESILEAKS